MYCELFDKRIKFSQSNLIMTSFIWNEIVMQVLSIVIEYDTMLLHLKK
jgi:hypothetical protein